MILIAIVYRYHDTELDSDNRYNDYLLCSIISEKQCPATMEWNERGSACPLTCANLNSDQITCIAGFVDGCHCPAGLWKDGERCVPKKQCSCNYAGIYYQHRSKRKSACEEW